MNLPEEIRKIRQRSFLTQEEFAKKLDVAFSTVNRWERGKAKPNIAAMKNMKELCREKGIDFTNVEEEWLNYKTGER